MNASFIDDMKTTIVVDICIILRRLKPRAESFLQSAASELRNYILSSKVYNIEKLLETYEKCKNFPEVSDYLICLTIITAQQSGVISLENL